MNDPELQEDELAWVQFTERGAGEANSGQLEAAEESWLSACAVAERFAQGDPRHAASLNNLAVIARFAQRLKDADRLYHQALRGWDQARGWVKRMQLAPRARSSLFHMRLELSHRDHYARLALDEYFKQLPRGAAVTFNNCAEGRQYIGKRARAISLYRKALDQYETTPNAPADAAEAIRRNLVFCEDVESEEGIADTQPALWAPALDHSFIAQAEREGWIIDLPPEFTDEGRFMAGLICACLIEQKRAIEPR